MATELMVHSEFSVCPECGAAIKDTEYDSSWVDEAEGLSALLDDDW